MAETLGEQIALLMRELRRLERIIDGGAELPGMVCARTAVTLSAATNRIARLADVLASASVQTGQSTR
jgi:hypothetical protein